VEVVQATWTQPRELLAIEGEWSEPVMVTLAVESAWWDQGQPQLLTRMPAGTIHIEGELVVDRTGFWLWGRHQKVDIPREAALDGVVEILLEPIHTTHFRLLPSGTVEDLHVGDALAIGALELEAFDGQPGAPNVLSSTSPLMLLMGLATLWLWWRRRDPVLLWFSVPVASFAISRILGGLGMSGDLPYFPGFAALTWLSFTIGITGICGFMGRLFSPDLKWVTVGLPTIVFGCELLRALSPHMYGPGTTISLVFLILLGVGLWRWAAGVGWFLLALGAHVGPDMVKQLGRMQALDPAWLELSGKIQSLSPTLTLFAMVMLLVQRLARNLEAVERFVPREYLAVIGATDLADARPGHRVTQTMAVLFTDIRGFTALSERLGPEATAEVVDAVLGVQAAVVAEAGGFVDKYIGDAVMALFSDPADAVRAAEACVEGVQALNPDIGIGAGIHLGELQLGTVGTDQRMSCTAIGDTVNLAARIEGLTRVFGNSVLLSEQTALAAKIPCRRMDRVRVKGRAEPVVVVEPGAPPDGWDAAFEAWADGRFAEAAHGFRGLNDALAERCERLHAAPPTDWDGVTRMSIK